MRIVLHRAVVCALAASSTIFAGATTSAATLNLIKNGGFERPVVPVGSFELFSTGQTFNGWHVVGATGNVAVMSGQFMDDGITFNAKTGAQWLDLTGTSNAATGVSQTVATTPGASYLLSFCLGNVDDPQGPYGVGSVVTVYINGVAKLGAANALHSPGTQRWKQFSLTFTATSSHTRIKFINDDGSNDSSNGLDKVSLTPS